MGLRPGPGARRRVASAEDTEHVLSPPAQQLRTLYVQIRSAHESLRRGIDFTYQVPRRYDGGPGRGPEDADRTPVWELLAAFVRRHKVDAEDYLRYCFALAGLGPSPEPNQVMTFKKVELYREELEDRDRVDDTGLALRVQRRIANSEVDYQSRYGGYSPVDAVLVVLLDDSLDLSPLFRYCLACAMEGERFEVFAESCRASALAQFNSRKAQYLASWREWLPADVLATAE